MERVALHFGVGELLSQVLEKQIPFGFVVFLGVAAQRRLEEAGRSRGLRRP